MRSPILAGKIAALLTLAAWMVAVPTATARTQVVEDPLDDYGEVTDWGMDYITTRGSDISGIWLEETEDELIVDFGIQDLTWLDTYDAMLLFAYYTKVALPDDSEPEFYDLSGTLDANVPGGLGGIREFRLRFEDNGSPDRNFEVLAEIDSARGVIVAHLPKNDLAELVPGIGAGTSLTWHHAQTFLMPCHVPDSSCGGGVNQVAGNDWAPHSGLQPIVPEIMDTPPFELWWSNVSAQLPSVPDSPPASGNASATGEPAGSEAPESRRAVGIPGMGGLVVLAGISAALLGRRIRGRVHKFSSPELG